MLSNDVITMNTINGNLRGALREPYSQKLLSVFPGDAPEIPSSV